MPDRIVPVIRCGCDGCKRVVARIEGDKLIIEVRHDRADHEAVISLSDLTQSLKTGS